MTEFDWKRLSEPAAVIQALQAHRLLPVARLLAERGLLREDLVPLAEKLAGRDVEKERRRAAVEDEVLGGLGSLKLDVLVLKGALLGRTVYPAPEARIRTDIDLLVASDAVEDASAALRAVGFAPSYEVHGGPPMTQAQWIRDGDSPVHAVDLHWDLFNLPLLKSKFGFSELLERADPIADSGRGVMGLSRPDALVHACTHYFGHHQGEFRPDQWLLDMDLLWRAMTETEREEVVSVACTAGVAGLVAEGMSLASTRFLTPVEPGVLQMLQAAARGERSGRLLRAPRWRMVEKVRSGFDERGIWPSTVHLWRLAFPPAAHIRRKYPGTSRWALPWLYVRRMMEGVKK